MTESRFEIKSINILTSWRHNLPLNNDCTICRNSLNEDSNEYQMKGITSYVIVGQCGHSYHRECLNGWIKDNPRCPICGDKWIYKDINEPIAQQNIPSHSQPSSPPDSPPDSPPSFTSWLGGSS
jgi:hypothetical protein